ncbi:TLD domain-containing protein [Plasmodium berghei]|uniref:Oxidation resistance protein 1 n=2 Tax=Plasmodium berghei TaxID=5821 RepID=A0A509AIR8_PLABA|nr:TLD domain-containing protein [Plasmodium berghei ANKA]CXI33456.1 TLD domain-containing protein [Plasmodium berghei]SCM21264.1 TLD domain-containing protein [Plasmodium berghei]SCN24557.1 TLD domain-containing protein [Plasmodium berghei]SCO59729.1 TLD domain-containing protein [Plasmodium berghei]SCO60954.1 TLD domain-containing protein [Plasmodium berghei]|eukprot:XP_034421179.1 TLD domain-containing protein [Plasmodium berghei ANKA]
MDESQTRDKIKVLNVFQNEEITNKSQISNKFEFEKGVIRNAIISPNSSKSIKNEKEKMKKNCIIFREQCEYCLTDFSISGYLILTKESLLFEPDLRDKHVIKNGIGTYQIFIDLYDIYECAHIVVPTKYTYLYNNDDTCGFIQILLKSIYIEESKLLANKKSNSNGYFYTNINNKENSNSSLFNPTFNSLNNNNNIYNSNNNYNDDCNKQKGMSYYKYISKSLSYMLNLAQPLVQNTPFKGYKINQMNSTNNSTNLTKHITHDEINNYNKIEIVNGSFQEINNQNEQINKSKRNSFIHFDISSPKNNIIDHMHDNDLKIYQNINEINYSKVISSHPNITYKNNFNAGNYSSCNFKGDNNSNIFSKSKKNSYPFIKKNNFLQKNENTYSGKKTIPNENVIKNNILTQLNLQNSNKINTKLNDENREKYKLDIDNTNIEKKKTNTIIQNGEFNNFDESSYVYLDQIKREDINNLINDNTNSYIKQSENVTEVFPKQFIAKTSDGITYNNEQGNKIIKIKSLQRHIENDESHKKGSKKYEEKCFILFRFFNNNTAYDTTTKIITEIDNVKKSENKIKKTITSVPFTSNKLLKCIIKQSLIYQESTDLKQQSLTSSLMNDIKDFKSLALEPKLEYVNDAVKLLTKDISKQINYYLPPTLSIKVWKLAFCSSIHGVSFKTLYRSVANKGSIILLISDMNNVLFGCFLDKLQCDTCYYGSGENFLFTFKEKLHNTNYENGKKNMQNKTSINYYNPNIFETNTENLNMSNETFKKEDEKSEKEDVQTMSITKEDEKNKVPIKSDYIIDPDCSEHEKTTLVNKLNTQYEGNLDELTKNDLNQEIQQNDIIEYDNKSKNQTHYYDFKINNNNDNNKNDTTNSSNSSSDSYETNNFFPKNKKNSIDNKFICDIINEKNNEFYKKNNNNKFGINEKENKVNDTPSIQVYNWTTRNNYYVYSDERSITIGGGDNYALVINDDLCKGQTNKSTTYDNDLLTYDEEFEIQFLQLWIFDDT